MGMPQIALYVCRNSIVGWSMAAGNNRIDIDFDNGKITFGGVFRGLGSLVGLVAQLNGSLTPEAVPEELRQDFEVVRRINAGRRQIRE